MTLHIGMNSPGDELSNSPINDAITRLAARITHQKHRGKLPGGPELDVTFQLPGKLVKPDFRGMRMGGYTYGNRTLYFEVAVPEFITRSDRAFDYIDLVLQDMIDNAESFFGENGIAFDTASWRDVLKL